MAKKPEEYARAYAIKSLNLWGSTWTGMADRYSISPITNYVGFVRRLSAAFGRELTDLRVPNRAYVMSRYNAILDRFYTKPGSERQGYQESGKPDLFAALIDAEGRVLHLSVEVKAFVEGSLNLDVWRENQREWMDMTTLGFSYWIWLWGFPDAIPASGLRSKGDRERQVCFMIPGEIWRRYQEQYAADMQGMKTVRLVPAENLKKSLREKYKTLDTLFRFYQLIYRGGVFWLPRRHPLRLMVEKGYGLAAALEEVGEPYATAIQIKPARPERYLTEVPEAEVEVDEKPILLEIE